MNAAIAIWPHDRASGTIAATENDQKNAAISPVSHLLARPIA
jgi:hypothetical protein